MAEHCVNTPEALSLTSTRGRLKGLIYLPLPAPVVWAESGFEQLSGGQWELEMLIP